MFYFRFKSKLQLNPPQVELVTYWTLNVTVLRAKTKKSQDLLSESDLYVTLTLPTATAATRRTKTIDNNNNPEWNENFCFRVPIETKNILEIRLFDEDFVSSDDLVSTVLLDLKTQEMDSKQTRSFSLGAQTEDVLELEFELRNRNEKPQEYRTNGILMTPPLSVMKVKVQNVSEKNGFLSRAPKLELHGAYEKTQSLSHDGCLKFHVNRELETELGLAWSWAEAQFTSKEVKAENEVKAKNEVLSVPLKPLPPRHSANVSLALEMAKVDLRLDARERSKEELGVRLSLDVPAQEKDFLLKRRIVARVLQTLLDLKTPPSDKQVPTIALVASGGGSRASTGFLGSLKGLKELGVLDAFTYITGVSGSTCIEKMKYYYAEMEEKEKQGHLVSYIDKFGLFLEHVVFGQKNSSTLSEQQKTVRNGQNPLPIYTAVNVKDGINGNQAESGVRRGTQELAAGQVDVSSSDSPFATKNMTYSEADYDALIDLTRYNVLQSRDTILSALSRALSK